MNAAGTKTLCGKELATCAGRDVGTDDFDCEGCINVLKAQRNQEIREREWREKQERYQKEKELQDQKWKWRYMNYLESPEWLEKRAAVLERERWVCEGCRKRRATQVHHMTYAHVGNELLFELRALCRECHESFHERMAAW